MRKVFIVFAATAFAAQFIVACKKTTTESVNQEIPKELLDKISAQGFSADGVRKC